MYMKILPILPVLLLGSVVALAQDRPIGYWRAHYSYTSANGVATDGQTLFVTGGPGFFTYDKVGNELSAYSKVEGMADVNTTHVGYDAATGTTVIGYQNSNIDLYRNQSFYPIPDLKNEPFSGDKSIRHVYTENGMAYLSTGLGIMVLNLEEQEVKATYTFRESGQIFGINAFQSLNTFFYAATGKGLYRANKDNLNLQNFSSWTKVGGTVDLLGLVVVENRLYAMGKNIVYQLNGNNLDTVYVPGSIKVELLHIDRGTDDLLISEIDTSTGVGKVKHFNAARQFTDSFQCGRPRQALVMSDGSEWAADEYSGLVRRRDGLADLVIPSGPRTFTAFDIIANNREVAVAHGVYSDKFVPQNNPFGVSVLNNESWRNHSIYTQTPFGADMAAVLKDPQNGDLLMGSLRDGLHIFKANGSYEMLKEGSPIEPANAIFGSNLYPVISLAADLQGNIVVGQLSAKSHEIALRTPEGSWYHYTTPLSNSGSGLAISAAGLTIDNSNQKWYFQPEGGGVFVYNDNNTPDNLADDSYGRLLSGQGAGNLPDNRVYCLAKDQDGTIWIGTANGIGIVNYPEQASTAQVDAELRVVQYDQFAGYLFQNEQVRSIAVDGANRKWVGTGNGVWLISADGRSIVYRFTESNSPLPSNAIQKIAIDPVTGDVYIGTDKGMVSYRSTATEGGETNNTVIAYPNPVPSGYSGTIGIRGLVENADVRITDISGQLVFRTRALGGQAVWNGLDYTGRRAQSGVYLIFVSNKDGSQTKAGKMVFME